MSAGRSPLLPGESVALTVALAQLQRGEDVNPAMSALCILALARVVDGFDYGLTPASVGAPSQTSTGVDDQPDEKQMGTSAQQGGDRDAAGA